VNQRGLPRLAILISGRGTNLQAFIDACANGQLNAQISLVISNNSQAGGLQRARDAGIPARCIDHRDYNSREAFDQALVDVIDANAVDLVVLAGFMRILTPVFITSFLGRLVNIHPSLLPLYPGLHTHQRALDAGDTTAGTTVHFVTQELDGGPPVLQARVPVHTDDTAESLAARVAKEEHIIYPLAAQWLIEERLVWTDTGAFFDGQRIPATGIQYTADLL
tara:strand:+ start:4111 stop:4776 length:666 start_codon:yes stop_codon:yes gene_type:complete